MNPEDDSLDLTKRRAALDRTAIEDLADELRAYEARLDPASAQHLTGQDNGQTFGNDHYQGENQS